jgi:hypothetical protein
MAVLGGCSSGASSAYRSAPPEKPSNPPPSRIEAAGPEWEKKLKSHLRRHPVEVNRSHAEALAYVQLAKDYRLSGRYSKAAEACRKALEIWPECIEARQQLMELKAILKEK